MRASIHRRRKHNLVLSHKSPRAASKARRATGILGANAAGRRPPPVPPLLIRVQARKRGNPRRLESTPDFQSALQVAAATFRWVSSYLICPTKVLSALVRLRAVRRDQSFAALKRHFDLRSRRLL